MSLTQEQIQKLSTILSKLEINDENFGKNANDILNYMELLNDIDTTGVEPTVSVTQGKNNLRADKEKENKEISREELLSQSKQKVIADQIAIANIMK